jgi:hypothetical protein
MFLESNPQNSEIFRRKMGAESFKKRAGNASLGQPLPGDGVEEATAKTFHRTVDNRASGAYGVAVF